MTVEIIHPNATGAEQAIGQAWQFAIAYHPKSRMETMRLPELSNSRAVPRVPPFDGGPRLAFRISLQNRDAVTFATKHGRRAQSDWATTADQDIAHRSPLAVRARTAKAAMNLCRLTPLPDANDFRQSLPI